MRTVFPEVDGEPTQRVLDRADVELSIMDVPAGELDEQLAAEVTVDAYPGTVFRGAVDSLLPQVDAATRTLPVRLVLPNPGLKLRPGMYVDVRLRLPLGRQLVIPAAAAFESATPSAATARS